MYLSDSAFPGYDLAIDGRIKNNLAHMLFTVMKMQAMIDYSVFSWHEYSAT